MNAAKPLPLPFTPTPDRLAEYDRMARRARELDRRERALLETVARMGSWETHSPYLGRVTWCFGPGGLKVKDSTGEAGDVREIPRHTAYQMALKGKVEIVQDGKSVKKGRK